MTTPNPSSEKFVRLSRPAIPLIKLTAEHEPDDRPVSKGKWVRVCQPAVVVKLVAEPVVSVYLELKLTLRSDTDAVTANATYDKLTGLVGLLNAFEAELGGSGFLMDIGKSGVKPGPAVGLVLMPNNPNGADRRLATVAELLAKAASEYPGKGEVVARVLSVADPDRPLFSFAV